MVNDMRPSNMCIWKNLSISVTNTSFDHPCTKRQIYVFADLPHLIKLARNHLLDKCVYYV